MKSYWSHFDVFCTFLAILENRGKSRISKVGQWGDFSRYSVFEFWAFEVM